jgi:enamine deaminase RidA (YjgF/YER057c/UK114 family)
MTSIRVQKKRVHFGRSDHEFIIIEGAGCIDPALLLSHLNHELSKSGVNAASILQILYFCKNQAVADAAGRRSVAVFGKQMPFTKTLLQPPLGRTNIILFAWIVLDKTITILHPRNQVSVAQGYDLDIALVGSRAPRSIASSEETFLQCFQGVEDRLRSIGFSYGDVVKTWTYLDSPLSRSATRSTIFQEFNRARRTFYSSIRFNHLPMTQGSAAYPANTGVWTNANLPSIVAMACKSVSGVRLVPLENPIQTPAFRYPTTRTSIPPLFSRAVLVVTLTEAAIFVAGTGSVIDAQTVHPESAELQTKDILRVLACLLDRANLLTCGFAMKQSGLATLAYCIVYLRRERDYELVHRTIRETLPCDVPVTFVKANLCRTDHLVEVDVLAVQERI